MCRLKNRLSLLFPDIASEWHPVMNGNLRPEDVSYGSGKKAWWLCKKCAYVWKSFIYNRTSASIRRGCPACAGQAVSDNNRLTVRCPGVVDYWHPTKNGDLSPDNVSYGYTKKIWWLCRVCGYEWKAVASGKLNSISCPVCSGRVVTDKNSLVVRYPAIAAEWYPAMNGDLKLENVSFGSHKKVWWKCSVCEYVWQAVVGKRSSGRGCPACSGKVVSDKNRLSVVRPDISKEWHPTKNCNFLPENVSFSSQRVVWWLCGVCGWEWEAPVKYRTGGKGCLSCSGHAVTSINRLSAVCPYVASEWDFSRNTISPDSVTGTSHHKFWWVCSKCSYNWEAPVCVRTKGHNCPACSGRAVTDKNRLSVIKPELTLEWDFKKNFPLAPDNFAVSSHARVWWLCCVCGNSWKALISNRSKSSNPRGCPVCATTAFVSVKETSWLNIVDKNLGREVVRQVRIKNKIVDGFDPATNTVYEFLGDFWHGNPNVFDQDSVNPVLGKTFGFLFDKTLDRLRFFRRKGYNVISIWEQDFDKSQSR